MAYEIKTTDYAKPKPVLIDGMDWTIRMPGAGDEMALGQIQRRQEFLQKKIEAGTATEQDLDLYDSLEERAFNMFAKVFSDGSKDNASVNEWIKATPMAVIYKVLEEIKEQATSSEQKASQEPAES